MIKNIISLTTSIGVGQVIQNIVAATTPNNLSKARKITTTVGSMVASTILCNMASEYMEEQFDNIAETFRLTIEKKGEEVQSE